MAKKNEKRSFVMYDSFLEAMQHLDDRGFRECVLKIRDFALEGKAEQSANQIVNVIMLLAKPNLESARRRYEACVENGKKGAQYGKLSHQKKIAQNISTSQPQTVPQSAPQTLPLDVDADANEYDYVDANDEDETVGDTVSSFFSSIDLDVSQEYGSGEDINPLYSKRECDISSSVNRLENAARESTARSSLHSGVEEYSMGEYMLKCLGYYVSQLADMRIGKIPTDDALFWRAVDLYCSIYNEQDKRRIAKIISSMVNDIASERS
jgi:hypothetical protein